MALSPIDPQATAGGNDSLRKIAASYDTALTSVQNLDLESIQDHLHRIDALTKSLSGLENAPLDQKLLDQVTTSHSRLLTALSVERAKSKNAIEQTTVGRKALRGYGNRSQSTGTHIESLS